LEAQKKRTVLQHVITPSPQRLLVAWLENSVPPISATSSMECIADETAAAGIAGAGTQ
jgi:hypothetical protein